MALQQAGKYEEAIAAFEALNGYGDSVTQIEACRTGIQERDYQAAVALQQAGKYKEAIAAFEALIGYGDSATRIIETKYLEATALTAIGDYASAVSIFNSIKGYKDVDSLLENDDLLAAATDAREAKIVPFKTVGSYVTFGTYPQTSSGTDQTEIEWLVLDYDETNHKSLLLSRYGLDAKPYNNEYTNITWENCTIRNWLNNEFINIAFTADQQSAILTTAVDNSSSQRYSGWSTSGGNNTQDRIFLLSYTEANRYLNVTFDNSNNIGSRVAPTDYATSAGAFTRSSNKTSDGRAGWWWLRSPGYNQDSAAIVNYYGSLFDNNVLDDNGCVRPAFWLNLESDIF